MSETHQAVSEQAENETAETTHEDETVQDEQRPEPASGETGEGVRALWAGHRKKILAGSAALLAAAVLGTVLTFVLPEEEPAPPPYTVAVTYRVTGEGKATISYNTGDPDESGGREQLVDLPWTKKVPVQPESGLARVSIVLDKNGGKAQCAVAVAGQHRQRATAFGNFGRATCSAKVPEKGATS